MCLRHDESTQTIKFSVSNTGIEIAQDRQKEIFQEFVQASEEIHLRYGGTGLGLTISQRIVEKVGGTIEVDSELDKGCTFFFTIDLAKAGGPLWIYRC